jgi:hypothetical protein
VELAELESHPQVPRHLRTLQSLLQFAAQEDAAWRLRRRAALDRLREDGKRRAVDQLAKKAAAPPSSEGKTSAAAAGAGLDLNGDPLPSAARDASQRDSKRSGGRGQWDDDEDEDAAGDEDFDDALGFHFDVDDRVDHKQEDQKYHVSLAVSERRRMARAPPSKEQAAAGAAFPALLRSPSSQGLVTASADGSADPAETLRLAPTPNLELFWTTEQNIVLMRCLATIGGSLWKPMSALLTSLPQSPIVKHIRKNELRGANAHEAIESKSLPFSLCCSVARTDGSSVLVPSQPSSAAFP